MKALCGCYRKDEASDPQVYAAAVAAIFDEYDDEIVQIVTDPRTGLPSKCQWLPTIKEVREACETLKQEMTDAIGRERDLQRQFSDRKKYEAEQAAKRNRTPEQQAKVDAALAEAAAKLGPGLDKGQTRAPSAEAIDHHRDLLLRDYKAAGREPVYTSAGQIVSMELADKISARRGQLSEPA